MSFPIGKKGISIAMLVYGGGKFWIYLPHHRWQVCRCRLGSRKNLKKMDPVLVASDGGNPGDPGYRSNGLFKKTRNISAMGSKISSPEMQPITT